MVSRGLGGQATSFVFEPDRSTGHEKRIVIRGEGGDRRRSPPLADPSSIQPIRWADW